MIASSQRAQQTAELALRAYDHGCIDQHTAQRGSDAKGATRLGIGINSYEATKHQISDHGVTLSMTASTSSHVVDQCLAVDLWLMIIALKPEVSVKISLIRTPLPPSQTHARQKFWPLIIDQDRAQQTSW